MEPRWYTGRDVTVDASILNNLLLVYYCVVLKHMSSVYIQSVSFKSTMEISWTMSYKILENIFFWTQYPLLENTVFSHNNNRGGCLKTRICTEVSDEAWQKERCEQVLSFLNNTANWSRKNTYLPLFLEPNILCNNFFYAKFQSKSNFEGKCFQDVFLCLMKFP